MYQLGRQLTHAPPGDYTDERTFVQSRVITKETNKIRKSSLIFIKILDGRDVKTNSEVGTGRVEQ